MRKTLSILALAGLFLFLVLTVNIIHFRFFSVRVVLYDTLQDVVIAAVLTIGAYLVWLRSRLGLNPHEVVLTLMVGVLAGANYAISVPTLIDRSLSVYILEKLAQRGGAIRHDAFEQVFKDEYMPEHRLVDIRLTEQLESGTIRIEKGCVHLTDRGKRIVAVTRFYRTTLLPRNRLIMGERTDALTDPFRASKDLRSYIC